MHRFLAKNLSKCYNIINTILFQEVMIMITFQFDNGSMLSNEGNTTLDNHGALYEPSYHEKDGVLFFSKSAYISIPLETNKNDEVFVTSLSFLISGEANEDRMLFGGDGIPFNIRLKSVEEGFYAEACIDLKKEERISRTDSILQPECWHNLTFLLMDGESFFIINGKSEGRRVFAGNVFEDFKSPIAYIGKKLSNSVKGGFLGYLDSISFSDSLTDEQKALWLSETEIGAGEIESKVDELAKENIFTGQLINPNVFFSPNSPCHYSLYENGAIIWSPSYGSVWMRTALFHSYLDAFENHLIGLPVDDEVCIEDADVAYCLCDTGGLFIQYRSEKVETSFFVPSDFLTQYIDSGFVSTLGFPKSQPVELSLGSDDVITYQLFDRFTLFKAEKIDVCGKVIIIPNGTGIVEEYLHNYSKYGLIKDYLQGYEGNQVKRDFSCFPMFGSSSHKNYKPTRITTHISSSYLITDNVILCCIVKTKEDKTSEHEIFPADPDIFKYLKNNGGLEPKYKDTEKNTLVPYGEYKCIISPPKTTAKGTIYQNCLNGVIVKYYNKEKKVNAGDKSEYDIRGFTDIKVFLCHISSGKIDDFGTDHSAELYITVSVYRNDQALCEGERWPDYDTRKAGKSEFDIIYEGKHVDGDHTGNVHYDFNDLKGEDRLHLKILPYDFDKASKNDSLGRFDLYLDIDTGWGLYSNFLHDDDLIGIEPDYVGAYNIYNGIYLTESYGDNRGGRKNIKLNIRIQGKTLPYDLSENFRKYGYWSTDNFKSNAKFTHELFNTVFHASTGNWYDWILHFWDDVWYEIAESEFTGKKGLCFGLSTEALMAIHGRSVYPLPLNNLNLYSDKKIQNLASKGYAPSINGFDIIDKDLIPKNSDPRKLEDSDEVKEGFYETIRKRHLYQLGWEHVNYMIDKAIIGSMFEPLIAFPDITHLLDRDGYCLVSLFGSGGHTVLAYGYDVNKNGEVEKIYVADSNHPWWEDTSNPNGSYIKISSNNLKVELHYSKDKIDNIAKSYDCCFGTPYHILTKNPRVPSWLEVTAFILRVIVSIPVFAAANLTEFLYAICCSDDDVSLENVNNSGEKELNLPVFDVTIPTGNTNSLRILMTASQNARLKVKKKNTVTDSYALHISSRGKTFRVTGNLMNGESRTIDIRQGYKRKPMITLHKSNLQQEAISRHTRSLTDSSFEVKELSSMDSYGKNARRHNRFEKHSGRVSHKKRYYINLRPQRNKKYEVHSESCPYCKQIKNKEYLGIFSSPSQAILMAREIKDIVDGCRFCCRGESTD